ncbi:hypothetical protein BGY98DRAFT_954648 [Russula aff. rugulosa BPL654]|nr:hypothetical protein BGY98DRAFT_954648 [Russula aff. rugulosa BPL654]
MRFSLASAAALFLPVLVNAQAGYSPPAPSATSTPPAPPVLISPGLYTPQNFTAKTGTYVTFYFPVLTELHSATQGSFDDPCIYLDDAEGAGFDSGAQSGKQFTIQITNDQEPIWFFCKVPGHCGIAGMVGAINAPATGDCSFAAWLAASKALGTNAINQTYTGPVLGGVDAVATAAPS